METTPKQQILLVDDSAFTLRYHAELAQMLGLDALTAESGEKAIEMFHRFLPPLVLCDIMMPDMSGYEVLEILKETKPDVRLYFISAEYNETIVAKANSLGATGVLNKPLRLDMLKSILSN